MVLDGPRIRLRPWREADSPAFAAMNADPAVMRHFAAPLSRAESDAMLARIRAHEAEHGFCFWAAEERRGDARLLGFCGLQRVAFEARFTPAVEIGWRLFPAFWGRGLAREAAELALDAAFGPFNLDEVVAFTVPANEPSWGLMRRLGMRPDGGFEHPRLPEGHALRPHLLYRMHRNDWRRAAKGAGPREE